MDHFNILIGSNCDLEMVKEHPYPNALQDERPTIRQRVFFWLIALLLLFTAGAKVWMLLTDPFTEVRLAISREILWLGIAIEFSVAVVNLMSNRLVSISCVNFLLFLGLGVFAFARWLLGYQNCGCAGTLELPTWIFIVIDFGIVSVILFINQNTHFLSRGIDSFRKVWRGFTPTIRGQFAGISFFSIFLIALQLPFATPVRTAIFGKPLVVSTVRIPDDMMVGIETLGEVEIRNHSSFPARIIGVRRSCACFDFSTTPMGEIIPPNGMFSQVIYVKPKQTGRLLQQVDLFLEHPKQFRVPVIVYGKVKGD
jgi:hypothetical protein